jgi:hypothetical protein
MDSRELYVRIAQGRSKSQDHAQLIYLGIDEGRTYIAPFVEQMLFESSAVTLDEAMAGVSLVEQLTGSHVDLIVVMAAARHIEAWKQPGDFMAVCRIHQVVDVSIGQADVVSRLSKREQKRRVMAMRDGFDFDVSRQDEDFYQFYRSMHVPTMHNRYGSHARSVEEHQAYSRLFKQGVLVRIHFKGIWVAGSVSQIDASTRTLNARLIGVREGAVEHRHSGAQNFVYHAILQWAASEPDIDYVDFQGCEPFLTKGTFQYKKRFATRAVIPDNLFGECRLLIRANRGSPSARQFLINNPWLGVGADGHLVAHYCFDREHGPRTDIPFRSDGIVQSVLIDLDNWNA